MLRQTMMFSQAYKVYRLWFSVLSHQIQKIKIVPTKKSNFGVQLAINYHEGTEFSSTGRKENQQRSIAVTNNTPPVVPKSVIAAPPDLREVDVLLEELEKVKNVYKLLELSSLHHSVMNNKHLAISFQKIYTFAKENYQEPSAVTSVPGFKWLCERVIKRARFFNTEDVINIFRTLSYLKVPYSSAVCTSLCQMIRHTINDLKLSEIIFLDFLFHQQKPTPLVSALKMALPLVMESQLDIQLDHDDVNQVARCLTIAIKKNLKSSTVDKLVQILLRCPSELQVQEAFGVCLTITQMKYPTEEASQLLNEVLEVLVIKIDGLSVKQISWILSQAIKQKLYHKKLFEVISKKALAEHWQMGQLCTLLQALVLNEFVFVDLLMHLAKEIISNPSSVYSDPQVSPLSVAEGFALSGFSPPHAEEVWRVLAGSTEKLSKLEEKAPHLYIKFFSCLAQLDFFPLDLLEKMLKTQLIDQTLSNHRFKKHYEEVLIDACILHRTSPLGPFLPSEKISEAIRLEFNSRISREFPLQKYLEIAVGGPQFLKTGLQTRSGHFIDHMIVMRKGDYPVAINDSTKESSAYFCHRFDLCEDVPLPFDGRRVAIVVADKTFYCREPPFLKGYVKSKIKSLSQTGFSPVLINLERWSELLDHEKIPYLMREVKESLENSGPHQEVVFTR
ncbi:FAST kinase domain-containing protein 5, mitochondrial-like [Limulus polyphemus]|uniref:FAST kinase domain-containing protein 5, mitochondrial-like n=1 Tax=Limulus polyphemus TaxID=6850 RepID=A0ABM1SUV8_LIMPO|nr:FAST kinase domain-containing protein 5, mitochondrial-like [Limulus polyphemus]